MMGYIEKRKKEQADFCSRPLLKKIILFSVPLILSGVLQLFYNAADIVVLGQFAGDADACTQAQAAVASTNSLISLIINLFMGLSVGALSSMSKYMGAKKPENAERIEHTAILMSVIGGVALGLVGFFCAPYFLELMQLEDAVMPQATLYLRIYFIGMPVNLLYNFGSAIMRACGDTKRPLIFLALAGLANVGLNLWLVIGFGLGVAGVAIGTIVSQAISSVLVVIWLMRGKYYPKLELKKLRLHKKELWEITRIGLPAGIQSTIFSLSNVIIQAAINGFGSVATAGNGVAINIEGFVYAAMNAFSQACLTFTGQNYGADKYENIDLVLGQCTLIVAVIGLVLGGGAYLIGKPLCLIYNTDLEVVACAMERLLYVCVPFFLCGIMEVLVGSLRGIGSSMTPMIVSIVGVCGLRIVWIYTLFEFIHTLQILYISYALSWLLCDLILFGAYLIIFGKEKKQMKKRREEREMRRARNTQENEPVFGE